MEQTGWTVIEPSLTLRNCTKRFYPRQWLPRHTAPLRKGFRCPHSYFHPRRVRRCCRNAHRTGQLPGLAATGARDSGRALLDQGQVLSPAPLDLRWVCWAAMCYGAAQVAIINLRFERMINGWSACAGATLPVTPVDFEGAIEGKLTATRQPGVRTLGMVESGEKDNRVWLHLRCLHSASNAVWQRWHVQRTHRYRQPEVATQLWQQPSSPARTDCNFGKVVTVFTSREVRQNRRRRSG